MVGIRSYGVYVPLWRLDLGSVREGLKGEKAIANFDEDSLTMAVAAGMNCIQNCDRGTIDALFLASSTFPYKEKQSSVTVATALDLREDIATIDFGNSLRAGTNALRAAIDAVKAMTARQVLVIASDIRLAMPGSDFEGDFGDGAASLLISNDCNVAINDSYSIADEMFDIWRTDEDKFVRSWEERFIMDEGYFRVMPKAVSKLMEKNNMRAQDFSSAVFYGANARRHREMGTKLGFTEKQIQAPLFGSVGDTGAASALMMLTAAIDKAKPGDKILLASYGNGADAFLLDVVNKADHKPVLADFVASKMVVKDYKRYLNWRGLVEMVTGRRRPPTPSPAVTCLWREVDQTLRLRGVKCKNCGMVQYPPQSVCYNCHTRGRFDSYSFSGKPAKLTTYTEDYATPTPNPPLVLAVVDFEGGGRMWAYMTDKGGKEIKIQMPVEMTFRKLFTNEGINNYAWKCMPSRFVKEG